MKRTSVIFSPIFYRHKPGKSHPESIERLRSIIGELEKIESRNIGDWQFVNPERARLKEVGLVHGIEYVEFVEKVCRMGGGVLDLEGDTVASKESFQVALNAVGGTLKAVKLIMRGECRNSFALVRPPGHHASKYSAGGFCIFNNIAIAAKYLLKIVKLGRVLILDVDAHHGNGTQEIFYSTSKVLYISLHQDPRDFPGAGFMHEIGEGEGLGYTVNIPLPFKTGDQVYSKAIREIVVPIIRQYRPQFILVSAGLDGHYSDPVADLSLSALCYQEIWEKMVDLASQLCGGKLLLTLEGGYSLNFIGKIALATIAILGQARYDIMDRSPAVRENVRMQGEKVISQVRKVQGDFWDV